MYLLRHVWLLMACFSVSPLGAEDKPLTPKQAEAQFDSADKALNQAWAAVKKTLSESEFIQLKEEQRLWVEYRDMLALSSSYTGVNEDQLTTSSTPYYEAAAGLTEERTIYLVALAKLDNGAVTLTGSWTDSYGGHLDIVERDGHFFFVMECARGPTIHTGGIAGNATWNDPLGWFEVKEDDKPTNISFILRNGILEVTGANTGYFHGARAYFDGKYVKTHSLNAKEQAAVVKAGQSGEVPDPTQE